MRKILAVVLAVCLLIGGALPAIAGTISGKALTVADDKVVPVAAAYVQLHKKDSWSGYLILIGGIFTAADGTFAFVFSEPAQPVDPSSPVIEESKPIFEEYLLEAGIRGYHLGRVTTFFDGVTNVEQDIFLSKSPVALEPGQMSWIGEYLVWPLVVRNQTSEIQVVSVYGERGSPTRTSLWATAQIGGTGSLFPQVAVVKPGSSTLITLETFVPRDAVPDGYSVCIHAFVTAPGDGFTVHDDYPACLLKSSFPAPPTPKG